MLMKANAVRQLLFQAKNPSPAAALLLLSSQSRVAAFSTATQQAGSSKDEGAALLHKKQHIGKVMDPRFYEDEFLAGRSSELEFVRHPFYDLAKAETMDKNAAETLIDEVTMKIGHLEGMDIFLETPIPTRENVAYTRYSDKPDDRDPKSREVFDFPKGKPYSIINNAELFRVQRWSAGEDKWASIRRSKDYLAAKFLPPFTIKDQDLMKLISEKSESEWKDEVLSAIPKLNHNVLIDLALYLAYDAKCNDKQVWMAIEDASLASLHHFNIT